MLATKVLRFARSAVASAKVAVSSLAPHKRAAASARATALRRLNVFSRKHSRASPAARKVLVDGTWDNANYWTRFAIVRRALALDGAVEVGVLGEHSRKRSRNAFAAFGISELVDLHRVSRSGYYLEQAEALLGPVNSADDLMHIRLPYDFPPEVFFDGVLKRQRRATVDVTDPMLKEYLAEALARLKAADDILAEGNFDLVILSHALDYTYGAVAWAAIRRGIRVLALYGDFGHAKFFRLKEPADLFMYPERPSIDELDNMPEEQATILRNLGAQQLAARLCGKTTDVGAIYAYQRRQGSITREEMAKQFGWDTSRHTIGVYNSNWFDYPHASGLHNFRDFLDWISTTLEVAKARPEINWLFKAHPCDDWYNKINGQRLEDLVAELNLPHIRLADKGWNGLDLMRSLDGIITCHGTIGIEATSQSIPVLVPYPGWYGHAGFVMNSNGRTDYLARLKTDWWKMQDLSENQRKADLFAGWAFCVPDWHGGYTYLDDSQQDKIYAGLEEFLQSNGPVLSYEADEIAAWFADGHPYFHVFAMTRAKGFQLGNCRS